MKDLGLKRSVLPSYSFYYVKKYFAQQGTSSSNYYAVCSESVQSKTITLASVINFMDEKNSSLSDY